MTDAGKTFVETYRGYDIYLSPAWYNQPPNYWVNANNFLTLALAKEYIDKIVEGVIPPPEPDYVVETYRGIEIWYSPQRKAYIVMGQICGPLTYARAIIDAYLKPPVPVTPTKTYMAAYRNIAIYYLYPDNVYTFTYEGEEYKTSTLEEAREKINDLLPPTPSTALSIQTIFQGVSGIREIRAGQPITISSRLTRTDTGAGIVNKPVNFWVNGANVGLIRTNNQAVASVTRSFNQAGDFDVYSTFSGESELKSCESEHISIKVIGGWTEAQKAKMREIGLSDAEIVQVVPANASDIIAVGFEVPRLRRWNKGDLESEARNEVDKVLREKEPGAEVLNAYARSRGTGWVDWTEGWDCFVFIGSPLEPATVALIALALKLLIVALIAVAIIWWRWVDIKLADTRQEEVEDINTLIESIRNDPNLTPEQKDAYINRLLGLWENAGGNEEGWLGWLKKNWTLIALGVGAIILIPILMGAVKAVTPKKEKE